MALALLGLVSAVGVAGCGGPAKVAQPSSTAPIKESPAATVFDGGSASADAGVPEAPAIVRTPEEKRLEEEVRRAATRCTPPAKWSECEDAIDGLKKARRKETAVADVFLLEILERDRGAMVRRVVATLFVDLDRASPLLREAALASRLVAAADRESDRDVSSILAWAIGNVDLEATKLDDQIRDFGLASKESMGGNFPARVVHNARLSPRAATVTSAWLASQPSPFRRIVQLSVAIETNDRNGAAFCAAMLDVGKSDASSQRAVLDAVSTGEGCTKAQRSAAKVALEKRR